LGVEMGTIEEIFEVGPTHDLLGHPRGGDPRGAYEFHPVTSETDALGADRALWQADAKRQRSLRVLPTHKGLAPPGVGSAEMRVKMRATAGTLFYARNLRWTSQALLAATTAQPALGGRAWTALRHADMRVLKAAALWWNSTLGLIVHWTQGQRTQTGRSTTQIGALKKIPCPRLDKLSEKALESAAARFDALSDLVLLPAKDAVEDPVRQGIDDAVSSMFEIHKARSIIAEGTGLTDRDFDPRPESGISNALGMLKEMWCDQPSVHGSSSA